MEALAFKVDSLPKFDNRRSRFVLDLSGLSLIELMEEHQRHKRMTSPNYTNSGTVSNLRKVQENCLQVLMPEDITDEFYSYFLSWGIGKGLKMSSISNYCNHIKSALNWGNRYGVRLSPSYDIANIKVSEPHRIALTPDDVSHIAHFDVKTLKARSDHRRTLENVRDTFVLQTNLFCRYSDMRKIDKSNFSGDVFTCVQQKTGGKAVVDMKSFSITPKLARKLLEKHDFSCPYKGDINNYNKYLHELLSKIGGSFNDEVIFEEKIGGEIVRTSYKKWELIASHTSRRTAITNAIKATGREVDVRRCSGHASSGRDSFRKYIVYE